jgi:hypothetical protein
MSPDEWLAVLDSGTTRPRMAAACTRPVPAAIAAGAAN